MKPIFTKLPLLAAAVLSLASCSLDKYDDSALFYPNAIVTVKTAEDGTCYFQLTDDMTVRPVNISRPPFGDKEVRALVNITEEGYSSDIRFDRDVKVHSIDSVRTKPVVPTLGAAADAELYGEDPIEVLGYWVTGLEDGYLTLSFCGLWSNPRKMHSIDLVAGTDPDDPDLYVLRHNALDDRPLSDAYRTTGIIAFNLRDASGAWPQTLTLKYKSFGGERTVRFTRNGYQAEDISATELRGATALRVK